MVRVFLSHSSQDKPFVRELADALEAGGEIKVWLDEREIGFGENIVLKIADGLDVHFVLLILSPDSVESKWVKEEWTDAYWDDVNNQQTRFAGVLFRDCQIPRLLRNKKYFDLRTNQIDGFHQIRTWLLGLRPPPPAVIHLPQRPSLVIGREQEIESLRSQLKEPGAIGYISGQPGGGKTTLALEYAHRYQRDFEAIHWLPCQGRSPAQIAGDLAWQLGLKLEGDLDAIIRDLNAICSRKRCLLVFDNVEDDAPARLLPGGRTSVLITTRHTNLPFLRLRQPLRLPLFTEEECFEVFEKELGRTEVEKHRSEALSLFRRLGNLPLGIVIAVSLIREDVRYTIAGMARHLPADVTALLKEAIAALSSPAQDLLSAMAVCAPEGFRLSLAAEIAEIDQASALDALQEIHSRSLVEELDREKRRYRVHALVREASAATDPQRQRHAGILVAEFDKWETDWSQCAEDMADWQLAFSWLLSQLGDDEMWRAAQRVAFSGSSLTYRLGRWMEAYEICQRMRDSAEQRADAWAQQAYCGNQAIILQDWGRLDEAMDFHKKEEAICIELGNQDGLQACYGNQALILQAWGRLDEAMELHKKQEDICSELGNQDGLQVCYGNQALILQAWGRLDEAMELHKKQEDICSELGNQDSLQRSYGNQAIILKAWGRLDEAMELHKKEEDICLELGNQNGLAASYGNQAIILQAWGRLDEAMELHKKEEDICLELGNQDGLQACYGNQALILQAWGRLDEAMELHKKQEDICSELGNQDGLQRSYGNQALILKDWGRLDEAMELHKRKEAICIELGNRNSLALCYASWGLLARERGDRKTEREKLEQSLALFTELGMPREIQQVQNWLSEINNDSQPD